MAPRSLDFRTLITTLALAGTVNAQGAPPKNPEHPRPAGPATPGAPPGGAAVPAATAPSNADIPPMPDIKDPMLEPVPPAPSLLGSWQDALKQIRARSTTLHRAQAQIEQAEGVSRSAVAQAAPTLSTTGTGTHLFTLPNPNPYGVPSNQFVGTLDFKAHVFNPYVWSGISTARENARAAALSEKDVQRTLLATIAQDAVAGITNERIVESNRVSLASALSTADLTKRRAALGAANAVDVLRAEGDVATARALIVSGDETLRITREALGADLGYTGQWGVSPNIRVEDLQRTAAQICRLVPTTDSRADVRAAAKSVDAAKQDRKTADYLYSPTVDLTSQAGYFSFPFRSPSLDHWAWGGGISATWVIFDGGDRYGQRRQKEAAVRIAQETLTQTQRAAALQALQAERGILVARATLDVSARARDVAKEQARLSRLAFVNGSGTSFDLVDSAKRLREAEIDLLNKQFGVFQAEIAAFLAKSDCSI